MKSIARHHSNPTGFHRALRNAVRRATYTPRTNTTMTAKQAARTEARREAIRESARHARDRDMASGMHPDQVAERPRYYRIPVYMTPAEYAKLTADAGTAPIGDYVRDRLLGSAPPTPTPEEISARIRAKAKDRTP